MSAELRQRTDSGITPDSISKGQLHIHMAGRDFYMFMAGMHILALKSSVHSCFSNCRRGELTCITRKMKHGRSSACQTYPRRIQIWSGVKTWRRDASYPLKLTVRGSIPACGLGVRNANIVATITRTSGLGGQYPARICGCFTLGRVPVCRPARSCQSAYESGMCRDPLI